MNGVKYIQIHEVADPFCAQAAVFNPPAGTGEAHLLVHATRADSFSQHLAWMEQAHRRFCDRLELRNSACVWFRFFLSDINDQKRETLRSSYFGSVMSDAGASAFFIGQPPAGTVKIALWAYHVFSPEASKEKALTGSTAILKCSAYTHIWHEIPFTGAKLPTSCREQTRKLLEAATEVLRTYGADWLNHAIRTWIYIRDIEKNYTQMVEERSRFFETQGLTPSTHYVASTGIEGEREDPFCEVSMLLYAMTGHGRHQFRHLHAKGHMCSAGSYGVTFERGTAVVFGDRVHIYISGTASIDSAGQILHENDLASQLKRISLNIRELLKDADASERDMAMLIVYLRDLNDWNRVSTYLNTAYPAIPALIVKGTVCRPQWLVEIECLAIRPADNRDFPPF